MARLYEICSKYRLKALFSYNVYWLSASLELPTENGGSLTQIALFAQATLTKFALQQQETPVPIQPTMNGSSPEPSQVPATLAPTDELGGQAPTPNATAVPATAVPVVTITPVSPTATSGPLPTTAAGMTRVSFEIGTTNYTVKETIPANTTKRYALRLTQWQMLDHSRAILPPLCRQYRKRQAAGRFFSNGSGMRLYV